MPNMKAVDLVVTKGLFRIDFQGGGGFSGGGTHFPHEKLGGGGHTKIPQPFRGAMENKTSI